MAIKFISYSGKYPNLCSGVLTLEIDGEKVSFGNDYKKPKPMYPEFWSSGGCCYCTSDEDVVSRGRWNIDANLLPAKYRKYADEISVVFNKNVPHGCCGGCI